MGRGAIDVLASVVGEVRSCLVVEDANTRRAAGARCGELLRRGGIDARSVLLEPDRHGHVPGSAEQVEQIVQVCGNGVDAILGVGSGVINDLGKLAAKRAGKRYISVATAASMNGYGSPIAAIIENGVKKTLPAAATEAIIVDLDVIAAAPLDMTRSGFADLLSKATATADWMLAHLLLDEPYNPRPHELLDPVVRDCERQAATIGRAEPQALGDLMRGLIYGGFAMTIAGHSSPASGGEHLISHYWDMTAHATGGPHALHGYQVAFGTRLSAALYQRLLALRPDELPGNAWRPWDEQAMRRIHGILFDAVEPEARKQHMTREQYDALIARIRSRWGRVVAALRPMLPTPEHLLALHVAAGVPTDIAAVRQTRATTRHALIHAADVRARFTVLDLAREIGVLEKWAEDLLDACAIG